MRPEIIRTTHAHQPVRWSLRLPNGRTVTGTAHTATGARWKARRALRDRAAAGRDDRPSAGNML